MRYKASAVNPRCFPAQDGCQDLLPALVENCWRVEFRRSALAHPTIILHDGTTELERRMFLADPDPSTCLFPRTRFGAGPQFDAFHIDSFAHVASQQECLELCRANTECVMYLYKIVEMQCHLRRDMKEGSSDEDFVSGYKDCGILYYEGRSGMESVTVAKNLESVSVATREGRYEGRKCSDSVDCFVLVQYKTTK